MKIDQKLVSEFFGARGASETKNLGVIGGITPKMLARHRKEYAADVKGTPLLVLNHGKPLGFFFTGFFLTDEALAFRTVKDSFLASVWPFKRRVGIMPLAEVRSFQIGRHDRCYGTNYVGHQLLVNGEVVGLVRMGSGVIYDDKALQAINGFAQYLFDKGIADAPPREFAWQ